MNFLWNQRRVVVFLSFIIERNDLKCIIRSHAEVKSGCGLSHANCYTVFSAPLEEKGIMGGLIELRGDTLNLQGNVFKACGQQEAVALLEDRADYVGRNQQEEAVEIVEGQMDNPGDNQDVIEVKETIQIDM